MSDHTIVKMLDSRSYVVTAEGEFMVHEHEGRPLEVWRCDARGRWRRRKTMPPGLRAMYEAHVALNLEVRPPSAAE